MRDDVVAGAARALFATAWADAVEEMGHTFSGQDILNVAPPTLPEAESAGDRLVTAIESQNGISFNDFVPPGFDDVGALDYETLGHYLAMESLGHGVSWADSNEPHGLSVPHSDAVMFPTEGFDPENPDSIDFVFEFTM